MCAWSGSNTTPESLLKGTAEVGESSLELWYCSRPTNAQLTYLTEILIKS